VKNTGVIYVEFLCKFTTLVEVVTNRNNYYLLIIQKCKWCL